MSSSMPCLLQCICAEEVLHWLAPGLLCFVFGSACYSKQLHGHPLTAAAVKQAAMRESVGM